jgi:CheY-like chemotaxis protein
MKILVIDDSRFVQLSIERVLREAGYNALAAADGEQGLQVAVRESPDLILLDVMLPGLPGTSILGSLKHNPLTAGIPVIVLSGLSRLDRARLQNEGAEGFLAKSYLDLDGNCELLVMLIEKTLKKAKASIQVPA